MAVSVYTDPGSYTEEKVAQGAVTLGQVPLAVALIGIASPNRVFVNEPVVRGQTTQALTVAATSPHTATLSVASDQAITTTKVTRDGTVLPNAAFSYVGPTQIKIADAYYKATSVYAIAYIAPSSELDALANANAVQIDKVGSFQSVTSFTLSTDYQLTADQVDWSILTVATLTGVPVGPVDLSVNFNLKFSLDGLADITVNVQGATPNATTVAEIVSAINAALVASVNYGAPYANAASNATNHVKLSGVVKGKTGSVTLKQAAANSAHLEVFGIATVALPLTVTGTGQRPALGSTYYVSYQVTRPATDYNKALQFFSPASAYAVVGFPDIDNPLANYVDICFANGAPSVFGVIVKDSDSDGIYTDTDFITALAATEAKAGMTEILPISTSLNVQVATLQSVINMSSLLEKKRRRGWFGMARNTAIGDLDTPNTLIWLAGVTLQVPGDSPGRGRFVLTAPSECTRTITLQDGSQVQILLDGTALAAATAALQTSFTSASTTLLRKILSGFDSITELTDKERKALAAAGVNCVQLTGGKLLLTDPGTTERAGGGLAAFEELSVRVQADKTAALVDKAVDDNLVAIVPEDLADFVSDIKEVVGGVIKALIEAGDIGKYLNDNGVARDIDYATDIQAFQSPTDKRTFRFRYWINGKYPAKRFFGEFSVDNPFFVVSQNG